MNYENCLDCPAHRVISDPDPLDWFCDDDLAVYCDHMRKSEEQKERENLSLINYNAYYATREYDKFFITWSCRPYNLRKECIVPDCCPLK